ncbi:MAG TPA: hypothetical protein VFX35_10735 [Solirubrobacterales bacterium]|nr:hypothetical protein [Solirubrobacterales bacterium]
MPRDLPSVEFADLVRMLAEGIADAQRELDRNSAEMVEELAHSYVTIVPEVREVIDTEGRVTFERARPQKMSLLDLGITPTFYQFERSTVEVAMDVTVEEKAEAHDERPRYVLRADTTTLQQERKLNRKVEAHSKLTATLVPVPMPARLEPARSTTAREE